MWNNTREGKISIVSSKAVKESKVDRWNLPKPKMKYLLTRGLSPIL